MNLPNVKAYVLISEVERGLRALIASSLLKNVGDGWWELVPEDITSRARDKMAHERLDQETDIESADLIDYTDLGDLWKLLRDKDFRGYFSSYMGEQSAILDDAAATIDSFRNTVMHNRVLTEAGLEQLIANIGRLKVLMPSLETSVSGHLARLDRDDFYRRLKWRELQDAGSKGFLSRELINLPPPDFDDFVGRRDHLELVCKRLRSRYFPIVSLDGVGGSGKSALAYAAAERVWHSPDKPFTAVVYLTAKSTRLTHKGVEDLVPNLTTYESLIDTVLRVVGQADATEYRLEKREALVQELLSNEPVLLILDNLETVSDERIYQFIKEWDYPGKVLITSRRRLGELERVVTLPEMSDTEAVALARSVGKSLNLGTFVGRSNDDLIPLVRKGGNIPLAIKWLLGQLALGRSMEQVTQKVASSSSPVLDFCFSETFENLGGDAKTALKCLPLFDEPPSQGALIAATDQTIEQLEGAVEELIMASLVRPEFRPSPNGRDQETVYVALPLTLAFAHSVLERDPLLLELATARISQFASMLSLQESASSSLRYSLQNIGAKTDLGRTAAFQALAASQIYRAGDVERARDRYAKAHRTDPSLVGVLLLWAEMESLEGERYEADKLMKLASETDPRDPKVWFSWGRLKKDDQLLPLAEEYLRRAVDLDKTFFWSRFHLATVLSWTEKYQEAWEMLGVCNSLPDAVAEPEWYRTYLLKAEAECLRRWGDWLMVNRNRDLDLAEAKLLEALSLANGLREIEDGRRESQVLYREVQASLGLLYFLRDEPVDALQNLKEALFVQPRSAREERHNSEVHYNFARVYLADGRREVALSHIQHGLGIRGIRESTKRRLTELRSRTEKSGSPF